MNARTGLTLCATLGLILGMSLSACNQQTPAPVPTALRQGVSPTEIRIGASLPLSGHAAYLGQETLRGATAYFDYVNANGGVHGRKITLVARDDGYDPPRCVANTQQLIIDDKVFALSCYVGTPTTAKILPMLEEARIPLVGAFTGANALRDPFQRYVINVRPSYYQETAQAVKHLVADLGIERIGVFYQYDAYGFDGLRGTELALKEFGLAPVVRAMSPATAPSMAQKRARVAPHGLSGSASAVIVISAGSSMWVSRPSMRASARCMFNRPGPQIRRSIETRS